MIDDYLARPFSQSGKGHANKISDSQTGELQGLQGNVFDLGLSDELTDFFGDDGPLPPV
jgi:hypothetical protein